MNNDSAEHNTLRDRFMKNTNIIKRSVAGVLITDVAVCAFGCSKTSVSSKDLGNAFNAAAEKTQ